MDRFKNFAAAFLTILLMLVIISTTAQADTFRLAAGNGYAPFTDEALPDGGVTTKIVRLAFEEEGHSVTIDFLPWKRGYMLTKRGQRLGTFPYNKNSKREKDFLFSDPIISYDRVYFVRKDSKVEFNNEEDLRGLSFCKPAGYHLAPVQSLVDAGILIVHEAPFMDSCIKLLDAGKLDLIVLNEINGWIAIKAALGKTDNFRRLGKGLGRNSQHLMVSKSLKNGSALIAIFNSGLSKLKERGELTRIMQPFLGG